MVKQKINFNLKLRIVLCFLLIILTGTLCLGKDKESPKIVNIINFIRQCEPRIDWITEDVLYETVVEQIEIMNKYHLGGTFLLQYDAIIDPRYQKLLKRLDPEKFEIGVWWEIPQPLVENSGLKWRGRYPWDWHADVGFATGYTPKDREKLIDTCMADFKKIFGYYPKSVGSWFIDAHTLKYMYDKYKITASCNCKDQIGTDGYTLWGGYWNQGYYPSKKNAYMPAQNAENQIPVPIFRMLGSDPIHQYDKGLGTGWQRVVSLEPVYKKGGGDPDWCKWYFDAFVKGEALEYAYVQVGQENSFTWKRMKKGFEIQLPIVAKLRDEGKVVVKTLGNTGEWFRDTYKVTPPTSVTVLEDNTDKDLKTVWFNSRFYRANLLWEKGTMRFRDIHLFDESFESDYLTKQGKSSQCFYYTFPVVDGFYWSSLETVAGLRLKTSDGAEVTGGTPIVDESADGILRVKWPTTSPEGLIVMKFSEKTFSVTAEGEIKDKWFFELSHDKDAELPMAEIKSKTISYSFKDASYAVSAKEGDFAGNSTSTLRVVPNDNRIILDLSKR